MPGRSQIGRKGWHYKLRKLAGGKLSVISPKGRVVGHVGSRAEAERFIRARERAIHGEAGGGDRVSRNRKPKGHKKGCRCVVCRRKRR